MDKGYQLIEAESGVPIKAWTKGVAIEAEAEKQLRNVARLPFIYKWVAAMPDVHWGIGATLGTGNHFIEVCLDESDQVWFMLHSGSRGVGNRIGMFFIEMARNDMREHIKNLPDRDLAYFKEGSEHFEDYVDAVSWAQEFALYNRKLMMEQLIDAVTEAGELPPFSLTETAVNCHHNYVAREEHYGHPVFVTRKEA